MSDWLESVRFAQEDSMAKLSDLTPRELEILKLVLAGRTNKAIAAEIHICEKTVEFHLNNVYTKVGVRTRMLASVWAIRQGVDGKPAQIAA
jgi:DNA-binding NarL/FixJ family response regulator